MPTSAKPKPFSTSRLGIFESRLRVLAFCLTKRETVMRRTYRLVLLAIRGHSNNPPAGNCRYFVFWGRTRRPIGLCKLKMEEKKGEKSGLSLIPLQNNSGNFRQDSRPNKKGNRRRLEQISPNQLKIKGEQKIKKSRVFKYLEKFISGYPSLVDDCPER